MLTNYDDLTVVIPCKNESKGLKIILPELKDSGCKVIVVDDGSTDDTAVIAAEFGCRVISHRSSKGNGAAVKTGLRAADTEFVALMDGDGQHSVKETLKLYEKIVESGVDLVVGTRDREGQASFFRYLANSFYNKFASIMVNRPVLDLTSGQRVFRTNKVKPIVWLLPNTFSYPTTSTMVFYRLGYDVLFEYVSVGKALRDSHIKFFRDGFRFFLIIMKVGTLFSPYKLFVPMALFLFLLGSIRYVYTFALSGTFTNMSALLYVTSVIVFLMGVLSEQISTVVYSRLEVDTDGER